MEWLAIEVADADVPASSWQRAFQDQLTEIALATGTCYWDDHQHRWGVVLELAFPGLASRELFRQHPAVLAALDAAPDPLRAVAIYPGRGGGAGVCSPRRPRPRLGSGAIALVGPGTAASLLVGLGRRDAG